MVIKCEGLNAIMVDFYCYLERGNYKVLKFHVNDFSYFDIITSPNLSAALQ